MNGILVSKSLQQALEALQKTSYEVDVQEVLESRQFDPVLDAHLKRNYDEVLELIRMHHSLMYSRFVTLTII